jgi:hypothetical protein
MGISLDKAEFLALVFETLFFGESLSFVCMPRADHRHITLFSVGAARNLFHAMLHSYRRRCPYSPKRRRVTGLYRTHRHSDAAAVFGGVFVTQGLPSSSE